jgi:hypothetical protein
MVNFGFIAFLSWSTYNIVQSGLFSPLRAILQAKLPFIYEGITCPTCLGFWLGIIWTLILGEPFFIVRNIIGNYIAIGILTSGTCAFLEAIYGKLKEM